MLTRYRLVYEYVQEFPDLSSAQAAPFADWQRPVSMSIEEDDEC